MPKKIPEVSSERPGDFDEETIRAVVGEQYRGGDEGDGYPVDTTDTLKGISFGELAGELGPKGRVRGESSKNR